MNIYHILVLYIKNCCLKNTVQCIDVIAHYIGFAAILPDYVVKLSFDSIQYFSERKLNTEFSRSLL